ncbi:MAG: hypothetical protein OEM49_06910, partial [Myxococcales bacterium]|nr:hypothetical protein [Myxococcales bacterium]
PARPREFGVVDTILCCSLGVTVVGDLAYVANGSLGLRVIDVSNPHSPAAVGALGTPGVARDVEVVGGLAYVAVGYPGLRILDFGPEYHTKVSIDIEPGRTPNRVNPLSRAVVPVALLGSARFDVADVEASTLGFGPAGAEPVSGSVRFEDVSGDGITDLVADYRIPETGIALADPEACLSGATVDAVPFIGCDAIETLGPNENFGRCGRGFEAALALPPLLWWRCARIRHERE